MTCGGRTSARNSLFPPGNSQQAPELRTAQRTVRPWLKEVKRELNKTKDYICAGTKTKRNKGKNTEEEWPGVRQGWLSSKVQSLWGKKDFECSNWKMN